MTQNMLDQLDMLYLTLFQLDDIDDQLCSTLQSKLAALGDQIPILQRLASYSKLVKQGSDLPVRRINYNIKKLSESCKPRWNEILKLNCEAIIFFMIAFNGLSSLPDQEFSWLARNLENYVEKRAFPAHWILREQIRKVVSNTPRKDNTKAFLAKYNVEEMKWCEDPAAIDPIQSVVDNRVDDKISSCKGVGGVDVEEHGKNAHPLQDDTDLEPTVQKATSTTSYESDLNVFSHAPPLTASASLQQVMTTEHHQQDVVQHTRKHTTESVTHEDEDRQEKIKLIKRSNGKR
ncbi:hypothetical protein TSTA_037120 [Talaromyces stipitatus ATCC 10500]|uniref:Uncharacterized protein n=1 Tax=Talaromyces stipitatus (strain ATCC 10500 / CBS 375.48 / QM 6759 / NRRL 1006) TaxID=441959 RepID=B8M8H9_TALSN|nr:uncharacterized protein TSTA_037120 [Talaromyces stipitatus ATCC 10500]EED20492.1 hypothetical protein TSTA_037120 [Talaromyces stipitatus ATCC 10500]